MGGNVDANSVHAGCEVHEGKKTIATHWVDFTPRNRALVQPLIGPISEDYEYVVYDDVSVGDAILWIFAKAGEQRKLFLKAMAAVAVSFVGDGRLRFAYPAK